MASEAEEAIPKPGQWPVDPQEDAPVSESRLWVDGCFDFTHHGHAGAMLQAKQLGTELLVGIHSDEAIMHNKGPTVMTLDERIAAVESCRWANRAIPHAPYVTYLPWVTHYGCKYVVHGDDITTDSNGYDTYRYVKEAGRFLEVKRTPGISTTDLVGRMLLFSKSHFINNLAAALDGEEGSIAGDSKERTETGLQMRERIRMYALDEMGKKEWVDVSICTSLTGAEFKSLVPGIKPQSDQRVVYVDGSFDLFSSGHIEFLKQVVSTEKDLAGKGDWYSDEAKQARIAATGSDYAPAYVVVGMHSDQVVNKEKGSNYPIMNIYERALCTLQCKHVNAMILNAPWNPSREYLSSLPCGKLAAVYHGPTTIPDGPGGDPYSVAKELGLYVRMTEHKYSDVNAAQIVQRILKNRTLYEERQKKKGWKKETEEALLKREKEEASKRNA